MTDELPDFDAFSHATDALSSTLDDGEGYESSESGKDRESEICVPINCPDCYEGMSISTVVGQEDADRNERRRHEAVCTDCQTAVIITVMKTVGDYNELFGFDAPGFDWDVEDIAPDD